MSLLNACSVSVFLATVNAGRCQPFYSNVLGLTLLEDTPFALVFALEGAELRISKVASLAPQPWTVLDWRVDNIIETMETLAVRQVTFEIFEGMRLDEQGIWTTPDGGAKIAWFKDPDGNILSISQRR